MRLQSLEVENVLGCAAAHLQITDERLVVVAGPNASGKSSIAEAVRLALLGASERAPAKKDWRLLVNGSSPAAHIRMRFDGGEAADLSLPSGAGQSPFSGNELLRRAAAVALGHHLLSTMTAKDRRTLVAKLLGDTQSHDAVAAELLKRGHDQARVDAIKPLLRAGLDAAKDEAQGRAREAKGQWRQVTGETWGKDKSAEWRPAVLMLERPRSPGDVMRYAGETQRKIDALQRTLGAAESKASPEELEQLRTAAADLDAAEADAAAVAALLEGSQQAVSRITGKINAITEREVYTCPCCEALLVIRAGGLKVAESDPDELDVEDLHRQLGKDKADVSKHQEALRVAKVRVSAAEVAARRLKSAEAAAAIDVQNVNSELDKLRAAHATLMAEIEQANLYAEGERNAKRAAELHLEALAWQQLSTELGDPTLAAADAAGPAQRLNEALEKIAPGIGWKPVELNDSGELYYGGRPVTFCSESERWRADSACAIAIAMLTDLRLLILDRVDVLDPKSRGPLLAWLAASECLDTALAFITAKQAPKLPQSVLTLWLGAADIDREVAA